MKKYISLLVIAVVAFISSCSNEEVTISKTVNFTVNPSTVVQPFVTKYSTILSWLGANRGELESFSTRYKLRVRLYVYDKNGDLAKFVSGNFDNYDVKLKESFYLPVGTYTAIAISDIYRPEDNFEHWAVSGEEYLATLKIEDTGYFGDARTILGASKKLFTVADTGVDVNIDVQPAGSLFLVLYSNIFTFSDVTEYELSVNKLQSSVNYDSNGDYTISSENHNGKYDWRISSVKLEDVDATKYSGARRWATQLPMNNVGVCFSYWTSSATSSNQLGSGNTFDIKASDSYFCWLYLSEEGYSVDYVTADEATTWLNSSAPRRSVAPFDHFVPLLESAIRDERRHDASVWQFLLPKNL